MSTPLDIIIVEKSGNLKKLSVKNFKKEELYKKCGFKKSEDFIKQTEWNVKYESKKYIIQVYAKIEGKANSENKYDFPPPIDNKLFFSNCVIIACLKNEDGSKPYTNLSIPMWNKIYEKLFGGFEDLTATAIEDEEEEDELENIPKHKKTKQGYLKDGFVIDNSDDAEDDESYEYTSNDSEEDTVNYKKNVKQENKNKKEADKEDNIIEDIGSELSEESYDYDD